MKRYENPAIDVVKFAACDVICASWTNGNGTNLGTGDGDQDEIPAPPGWNMGNGSKNLPNP